MEVLDILQFLLGLLTTISPFLLLATAYTSFGSGEWNNQAQWNDQVSGFPDGADDTAAIQTGHAMTAAAGVVCGAITIAGTGSLVAQGGANTITSITNNGSGACTIGATTFAGVLNNASTGLLTISGACTAISNFTPANCNITATGSVAMTGTLTGPATTQTFAMTAGSSLTGFTVDVASFAGTWTAGIGCTITGTKAGLLSITVGAGGVVTFVGTNASPVTVTNTTAGRNISFIADGTGAINHTHVNLSGTYGWGATSGGSLTVRGVQFTPKAATTICLTIPRDTFPGKIDVDGVWVAGVSTTIFIAGSVLTGNYSPILREVSPIKNVAIGYQRDGTAATITSGIYATALVEITNAIVASSQINFSTNTLLGGVRIDNLGHVAGILPGTGSALDLANAAAGVGTTWTQRGSFGRSVAGPPSGQTYHARLTPSAIVTATLPLEMSLCVPVVSGDSVAVYAKASRSADTSDCAECHIDPEAAWFSGTSAVAWTLTNAATYYSLPACTATTAGGSGAKGQCRIVFRMKEYSASQYLDIGDVYVVVTHSDSTTHQYIFTMQNWVNGSPVSDRADMILGKTQGPVTLAKETGANAYGGSGSCSKLSPLSTTGYGYWYFLVPTTAATPFTLSFWYNATSGFNGGFKVTIWDTDMSTIDANMASHDVGGTYDGTWRQYTAQHAVTPTATGTCLVRIEAQQGAHSASDVIYIDDITYA